MHQPRKVDRLENGGVSVLWDDGHRSIYPPKELRFACRCAVCVDEWTGAQRLDPAQVPSDIAIKEIRPVGRYGLQFVWSDGHSTGIYTFQHLRENCPCETCRGTTTG